MNRKKEMIKYFKIAYASAGQQDEVTSVRLYQGFRDRHLNPDSNFSHFSGNDKELEELIMESWNSGRARPSQYKPGTFLVPLSPENFFSGVVRLKEDSELSGSFSPHYGHRELRKGVGAYADEKDPADYANAVIWAPDTDGAATVLTIIAGIFDEPDSDPDTFDEPMNPQALMYNRYSGNDDGHDSEAFDDLLEKSFKYWRDKAMFRRKNASRLKGEGRSLKIAKYSRIVKAPEAESVELIRNAGLKHHIERRMPISDSIYRFGSAAHFEMIHEARKLWIDGVVKFSEEDIDILSSDIGKVGFYNGERVLLDIPFLENDIGPKTAKKKKKKKKDPPIGKPKRGGSKKFYVYARCKGKIKKISFGSPDMPLRISEPDRRRSFVARHKCKEKNDRCTAGYWACRIGRYPHLTGAKKKYTWW
jgi:hypothetical protein